MPYKDKERLKEYGKKQYQKNKERRKEQNKEWYKNNKEKQKGHKREYYQNNKEHINKYRREYRYKERYNLTLEQIDEMLIKQNHKCLICGTSLMETRRCVDHSHESGKIRGILCDLCNKGLGQFRDNLEFLRKAVIYMEIKGENK